MSLAIVLRFDLGIRGASIAHEAFTTFSERGRPRVFGEDGALEVGEDELGMQSASLTIDRVEETSAVEDGARGWLSDDGIEEW